jgi:predicted house-cleaning noncanonical NTP pyrophosphatase (MazG superfamily)
VDIRSAQKVAWDRKLAQGSNTADVPLEFCLLSKGIADAFDAWRKDLPTVTRELSESMILLLGLAEMIGTDLQDTIEAALANDVTCLFDDLAEGQPNAGIGQGKLVRDKIPEIIRRNGQEPLTSMAGTAEYGRLLRRKLVEEVKEFLTSESDPDELADILEVVITLASELGISPSFLEEIRVKKVMDRGGFVHRIVWSGNTSGGHSH